MLRVEIDHPRTPIYIYPITESTKTEATVLPLALIVHNESKVPIRIGGLKATWQVSVQYPLAGKSIQWVMEWGKRKVLETMVTDVAAAQDIPSGRHIFQFVMCLPTTLPASRSTDFERVTHTLFAAALSASPEYSASEHSSDNSSKETPPSRIWNAFGLLSTSGESPKKGKENKAKPPRKVMGIETELPLPIVLEPCIASTQKDIPIVAPSFVKGQTPRVWKTHHININDLGRMKLNAASDFMTLGSLMYMCLRFEDLDPLATIYRCEANLEQRCAYHDESEVHHDNYQIHAWAHNSVGPDDPIPRRHTSQYIWRGPLVPQSTAGDEENPKEMPDAPKRHECFPPRATPSILHLDAAPRLPSPAIGGQVSSIITPPTGAESDKFSITSHTFVFDIYFSIYGLDEKGGYIGDQEGHVRKVQCKVGVPINDCSFSRAAIEIPPYTQEMYQREPDADIAECLAPYTPGTEPSSALLPRHRWTIRDGKMTAKGKRAMRAEAIRKHQLETDALCMCFFCEAHDNPKWGGDVSDVVVPYFGSYDSAAYDKERARRREVYLKNHPEAVRGRPGFLYLVTDGCICAIDEEGEQASSANNAKMSFGPSISTNTGTR